jgi:3-hydroxyisobutyrate dehydrogenase
MPRVATSYTRKFKRRRRNVKIGFIGLGKMGRGMAANLQKAGHDLVVTDLSRAFAEPFLAKGAVWADTPCALAHACDVVFTSLPTPADVQSVGFGDEGLAKGFREGACWFDLSTNSVDGVRSAHERLAPHGVHFLDAPVSGGPGGAASGKLAIWVGGSKTEYERCKAVLDAMADQARYVGEIGAGTIAKLVHNMAATAINAVMGEVMTLGVKAGLDPLPLYEAIRTGAAGRMRGFDNIARRFLVGKLDPPSFALRLVFKDVNLALELGREVNVPMRLCNLVQQDITEAMNRGWEARDSQSFLLLQQERAAVPPFAIDEQDMAAVFERT